MAGQQHKRVVTRAVRFRHQQRQPTPPRLHRCGQPHADPPPSSGPHPHPRRPVARRGHHGDRREPTQLRQSRAAPDRGDDHLVHEGITVEKDHPHRTIRLQLRDVVRRGQPVDDGDAPAEGAGRRALSNGDGLCGDSVPWSGDRKTVGDAWNLFRVRVGQAQGRRLRQADQRVVFQELGAQPGLAQPPLDIRKRPAFLW